MKLGGHGKRLSIISAVRSNSAYQFLCPLVFQGSCDRAMFTGWLSYLLENLAKNNQDQRKRHLLILDNASIHKNGDIEKLAKDFNCRIMYLPAYSPYLNPIEKAWSVLKSKVKNIAVRLDKKIEEALDLGLKEM